MKTKLNITAIILAILLFPQNSFPQQKINHPQGAYVEKESDNPWIWNSVHDAINKAGIKRKVIKIQTLMQYSIYTVVAELEKINDLETLPLPITIRLSCKNANGDFLIESDKAYIDGILYCERFNALRETIFKEFGGKWIFKNIGFGPYLTKGSFMICDKNIKNIKEKLMNANISAPFYIAGYSKNYQILTWLKSDDKNIEKIINIIKKIDL